MMGVFRARPVPCPILSQFLEKRTHCAGVDGVIIPPHAVARGNQVASDLPVSHATDELPPGRLILGGELNTRLSGVVQKLIVLNPEGGIPGFVVGVTVVSCGAHRVSFELKSV